MDSNSHCKVVMNEEIFAKLAVFPHSTSTLSHTNIYKWKFLDERDNLMILEFKCGWITLRTSHHYTEEVCVYSVNDKHYFCRILNIGEWLENNACHLEKTRLVYNATNEVIDKLKSQSVLGPNVYFAGDEYGWLVKAPKMHAKIFVDIYKDPNTKTIKLEYKDQVSGKTKTGMVDKKQLYTFLKNNLKVLQEKPVPTKQETVEKLAEKLEETHIESSPINTPQLPAVMSKDENEKLLMNSKLFIPIPKEQRIAYQTCKPIRRKFDYLLE